MTSDRVVKLVILAIVLLLAWYAGREGISMGTAVAIVGLGGVYWRPVFGVPVAGAMVAAAVYVPGVAAAAAGVAIVLALLTIFVNVVFDWGGVPPSEGSDGASGSTWGGW